MKLYLIRHSNAIEAGTTQYQEDSQRPLTEKGQEKAKKIGIAIRKLGIQPDLILSSPYVRAQQTAELLAKSMKHTRKPVISDFLVPFGEVEKIIGEINEKYQVDELLVVGHEPCLSTLIATLTTGTPDLHVELKNGSLCCLAADDLRLERQAMLEWLLTPKILLALA